MKTEAELTAARLVKKESVAAAGGQLVGAAFSFIGELFKDQASDAIDPQMTAAFKTRLMDCMEKTADGRINMTITLPDESFLEAMAQSLSTMVAIGNIKSDER